MIFFKKQNFEFQKEVLVNRNNMQSKNNSQSENDIIVSTKNKSLMKLFHNLNL